MEAEFVLEEGCYFYIKTILDKFHTLDPSPYIPKKPQFYIIFLENLFPTQYQVIASNPETYQ
jgi:hypothetical protein